jgi:hypothetical protein
VSALLSREIPISQVSGPWVVNASLRGADTVVIAGGVVITEWWLMTRPDIKTAEQLKGGTIGASFGGLPEFMGRIALKRLGLTPLKDVAILQIGGLPERMSALEKGKVQAVMFPTPDNFVAQKRGFYNLVSVRLPCRDTSFATMFLQIRNEPFHSYLLAVVDDCLHRIGFRNQMAVVTIQTIGPSHDHHQPTAWQVRARVAPLAQMFRKTYPRIRLISIIEPSLAATQTMANDLEPVMCWRTTVNTRQV